MLRSQAPSGSTRHANPLLRVNQLGGESHRTCQGRIRQPPALIGARRFVGRVGGTSSRWPDLP